MLRSGRLSVAWWALLLGATLAQSAYLSALGTGKPLRAYGQQGWQSDAGLPQNTVRAVVQTDDGFLWIATEAGLVRFDGVEFCTYDASNTPELRSDFINGLTVELANGSAAGFSGSLRNGSLWISTPAGLVRENGGTFTAFGRAQGLPSDNVLSTHVTAAGAVLALTVGGVAVLEGDRFVALAGTADLGLATAASIGEDAGGRVWIAGPERVLSFQVGTGEQAEGARSLPQIDPGSLPGSALQVGEIAAVATITSRKSDAGLDDGNHSDVWMGGSSGIAVLSADGRVQKRLTTRDGLPSDEITKLLPAEDGGMWIGTAKGLAHYAQGRLTREPALAGQRVEALYLNRGARSQVDTEGATRDRAETALTERAGTNRSAGNTAATDRAGTNRAEPKSAGTLWVATPDSVVRLVGDAGRNTGGRSDTLALPGVRSILEDREGSMWFGTETEGLHVLREQAFSTITREDGLSANLVRAVFSDHAGTLWIGTSGGGLDFLTAEAKPGPSGRVTAYAGKLPSKVILALAETRAADGRYSVWVGTPGGLTELPGGRTYTSADGLPDDFVRSLYADRDGTLWLGTRHGLAHLDPRANTHSDTRRDTHPDPHSATHSDARSGSQLHPQRNQHREHVVMHTYSRLDGLGSDLIGAILRSRSGTLYVGTLAGLSRMEDDPTGGSANFSDVLPAGAPTQAVTTLLEDTPGTLWMGTNGGGLTSLRNGQLRKYAGVPGPPGEKLPGGGLLGAQRGDPGQASTGLPATIYGMLEDGAGNLWMSSRKGVDRVSIAALEAYAGGHSGAVAKPGELPVAHYGSADGMRIAEASEGGHPAAARAADGGLWFATIDGAAVVHPESLRRNEVPPLTAIEQVLVDDRPVKAVKHASLAGTFPPSTDGASGTIAGGTIKEGTIRVAPGHGRLAIQYAGLSFVAPLKVRYRYRLDGFDKNWVEAGGRRTAFYTNVPPGAYRFLVEAANNDGVWSLAPASVGFKVEPYFYQTGWFYGLLLLSMVGAAYLVYRWRVVTVQAQYRAVLDERGRIAREIHDTLAQGYVAISVQLELTELLLKNSTEAATDAAVQQLHQTRELVREGLAEARSSIWNLRAAGDGFSRSTGAAGSDGVNGSAQVTLPSQLAEHLRSMTRRQAPGSGPTMKFAVHGTYRPVARSVEEEVLRIAQEAVANAVAHARATIVSVMLSYDAQQLELCVEDNGIGMAAAKPDPARRHFGLQGMRERAERLGAELVMDDLARFLPGDAAGNERTGTAVRLIVDLRRASRVVRTSRDSKVMGKDHV